VLVHFDQASAIFETWRGRWEKEERASLGGNSEADIRVSTYFSFLNLVVNILDFKLTPTITVPTENTCMAGYVMYFISMFSDC